MFGGHEIERDDQEYPSGITCYAKLCEFIVMAITDYSLWCELHSPL